MNDTFLSSPQKILFTDLDDTFTTQGKITATAFQALWDLYNHNIAVIPVTGRAAGFCELIARWWPVCGVVGENGAFYFTLQKGKIHRWFHPQAQKIQDHMENFEKIKSTIFKKFPRAQVASDQFSRLFDLAIDFAEEVIPPLTWEEAQKIKKIFEDYGATAKISSIHVNGWYGQFSKLESSLKLLEDFWKISSTQAQKEVFFIGDSPNDEPMFSYFNKSYAVANIKPFLSQMTHHPKHILDKSSEEGFCDLAKLLIK